MNSSELMLAAIGNGLEDDTTTSAALDAIREESNCSLLAAVLEVARVHHAAKAARVLTEANGFLSKDSPIRDALEESIRAECPVVPPRAFINIVCQDGDGWPKAVRDSQFTDGEWVYGYLVNVGAGWVKREANRLMVEHEQAKRAAEASFSGSKKRRAGRAVQ